MSLHTFASLVAIAAASQSLSLVADLILPLGRCMEHGECKGGEFCAPTFIFGRSHPGQCSDCAWSNPSDRAAAIDTGAWWFEGHSEEFWGGAEAYCNATDTMPNHCDHLVQSRETLSGAGFMVLRLSAIVAIVPTIHDLDQATEERIVMAARGGFTPLFYISDKARVYGLPVLVVGGERIRGAKRLQK